MNINGFKAKDGTVYKYDYNELANLPETPDGEQGANGGYYTPAVTQPAADTIQFDFTPSKADMPSVEPVQVKLPAGQGSGGNGDQSGMSEELKTALVNYYTHVMPNFDDANGLAYINAILTALGAETRGESGGEEAPDEPVVPDEPEKTLTSISATYSGGDVAVGTAVTALTGIVVTAHYSDGTSETVTGYTLSGTIAEGSNTITVSYGGKTTTFTVTGVAEESELVEVALSVNSGVGSMNIYSDDGATSIFSGDAFAQISNEAFETDTVVYVTFNYTGTMSGRKTFACCVSSEVTGIASPMTGHYGVELATTSTTENVPYTVKSGYKLLVVQQYMPSQGTFTVTKGA